MPDSTLLFIAEPQSVTSVFSPLKEAGYQAGLADNLAGAINFIKKSKPCLIFTRPIMQGYSAQALLAEAVNIENFPPVVVFSRTGSADEALKYMELGARDYWLEPLSWDKIKLMLPDEKPASIPSEEDLNAPDKPATGSTGTQGRYQIIGRHPAMMRVLGLAKQVAKSKATILISGESGTGKEMFARFLHHHSDRSDNPFVAINCAALPEHLLESELFGHEKGSFTGAINRKLGKFELASGGTILLDEITEMDLGLQAKLLRVLQEGEIDRVGGVETVKVDVRVLATTNRDIEETVKEGKFRQDLFYRLNVIPLKLPALGQRGNDIMLLAKFFVDKNCTEYGLAPLNFSDEARKWLLDYEWPGNVRELQNLMERAVLLAGGGPIESKHFLNDPDAWMPDETYDPSENDTGTPADQGAEAGIAGSFEVMPISEMEKHLIIKSLGQTSGNRTKAADLLGISVRTLRNKLNDYKKQGLEL
ncbi:sigma-54 dependent transcriptional regulator [Maridesulfovibrio hydrothermalis]|uniref:Two component, sigma54 specific, transcriptional regulator, Fis family n=1 Tax=Maridesulfovibrio hydrothermalis AM13 = DSM 14728 TaxID=1121451 RepID=L0R914_9BACT|nr:sigma-54 dependent transcriptional regulator [Maridesulfovibrio hydrothermalis]CCO22675.1 Two component, sigma54 specific, transcriptional regulator, Fis family [Maridesulfovibrio hydrothermalis AM13 = DSM 14728]